MISGIDQNTGSSTSDVITNDPTLMFTGISKPGTTVTVRKLGLGVLVWTLIDSSGNGVFDFTGTALADADYAFVEHTEIGNAPTLPSQLFHATIITEASSPTMNGIFDDTGASTSDDITKDRSLVIEGSAEPGSGVTVSEVSIGVLGTVEADGKGL